jgi:general secretion pathway protein D
MPAKVLFQRKWRISATAAICRVAAGLLFLLAACDSEKRSQRVPLPSSIAPASAPVGAVEVPAEGRPNWASSRPLVEIISGSGRFVAQPPAAPPELAVGSDDGVSLNFVNIDLREIVRAVLGDILKEPYVIDPKVQGVGTLETARPIDRTAVLPALDTMLRGAGFAITRSNGIFAVVPSAEALRTGAAIRATLGDSGVEYAVRVFPLRYIGATEMEQILRSMAPSDLVLRTLPNRNVIAVGGGHRDLRNVQDLISVFDVRTLEGMSFALLSPRQVGARTLARELDRIFALEKSTNYQPVRFIAIERIGLVIAIARHPSFLEDVARWTERLDQVAEGEEERIYVYRVQSGRAVDLAATLNELLASRGQSGGQPAVINSAVDQASSEPAATSMLQTGSGYIGSNTGPLSNQAVVDAAPMRVAYPSSTGPASSEASEASPAEADDPLAGAAIRGPSQPQRPSVIADDKNNALLILATARDWRMLEATIAKLDVPPLQVMIEAVIAEVTLTDELRYGVQWFFQHNRSLGVLTRGTTTTVNPALPGFGAVFASGSDIQVVLDALATVTKVNVVSAPQLMVLNNETASLQVGDQVPIATQQAVSTITPDAPIVNTIQFRDTGVILKVTPRVNEGGLVRMDIVQEVSEVAKTTTSGIDSPTIQQRKIGSTVSVQSGETIALGGLIRDRRSTSDSGVPLLKDIPLIGNLFKSADNSQTRTELLVLITPKAVRSPSDLRRVTEEVRNRMQGIRFDAIE